NHDSVGVIIPIKDKKDYFLVAADRNVYNLYWPSDDNENEAKLEHLITVDERFGDSLMAEEMERSLSISNGLDWCPEYKKLYHIDSQTRKIVAYDFDEQSGQIQNKKIIFDMADHPNLEGIPDGMTADGSGNLWIALFGGSAYCTSVCFGGPDSANLFVTTSRLKLNEKEVSETPNAGSVFAISYLGVKGRIVHEAII
ncbi:unnamed protein product, partial [Acanthoscelides obtectus]